MNNLKPGHDYLVSEYSVISRLHVLEVTKTCYKIQWEHAKLPSYKTKDWIARLHVLEDLGPSPAPSHSGRGN